MKTLIALNLKYLMEGREDDLQEDMEKFVDNLISVAKNLNENYGSKVCGYVEDYIDNLVSTYPNSKYIAHLSLKVAWYFKYTENGKEKHRDENEVRLKLNRELGCAYHKALEVYDVWKEFIKCEGKDD